MVKRLLTLNFVFFFLFFSGSICLAAGSSGGDQLLCAITEIVECDAQGECAQRAAEDVGLPDFVMIDLKEKVLTEATPAGGRVSSFNSSSSIEGQTVLSGVDGTRGWSAVLSNGNRRLSATVSDELVGFVVFGVCREVL
jgi:hypothetical protein